MKWKIKIKNFFLKLKFFRFFFFLFSFYPLFFLFIYYKMGNSQSIDKVQTVVKEGIKIYETIKKQQEQENHQQNHYQQQHYEQHYEQHTTYHHSADVDDDEHYSSLRQKAHIEAEKRNQLYSQSQDAYHRGDGGEGDTHL